jgi:D-arabinose 1-dehydrogenase-like Zn-dependent alcohol dehydrogenase
MGETMLVPSARHLVRLGKLDPREASPLSDAALTPYHAIKRSLQLLVPGSAAVVIGVGGLGQMAIQLLRDGVLSEQERAEGKKILSCVSRGKTRLVLDV